MADTLFRLMKNCLPCCLCLMTIAMFAERGIASEDTCGHLEFPDLRGGRTVNALVNSDVNLTFYLNTSACTYFADKFFVKLTLSLGESSVPICYLVYQNGNCSITDPENCVCLPDAPKSAVLYRNFPQAGSSVYVWSLSDSIREQSQQKTEITFNVESNVTSNAHTTRGNSSFTRTKGKLSNPDLTLGNVTASTTKNTSSPVDETESGSATDIKTTSPGPSDSKSEGDSFQVIIFTSIITLLVVGVPFVTAMVIYVHRIKKRIKEQGPEGDGLTVVKETESEGCQGLTSILVSRGQSVYVLHDTLMYTGNRDL